MEKPGFHIPLTIKEAIDGIYRKKYLLPAIQREFVWSQEQIIKLFDSLMRDYPISSFLFWAVKEENLKKFEFYEFLRNYHERDHTHNPKASIVGEKSLTAILDGQQRLTSLFIGLKGSFAKKIPRKRWYNDEAFPKKRLYLNLLSKSKEFDLEYDFRFLTEEEAKKKVDETFWFKVGQVIEFENELADINDFLRGKDLLKSYSDLLLSIATAKWKTKDAREEITKLVDNLNNIGEKFLFSKDFILKSSLFLSDLTDIAFKVDNFNNENMEKIEKKWNSIKKALRISIELISDFGYNYRNLTSANAIIPIAYYILKKNNPDNFSTIREYKDDREKIKKWFTTSLIKRAFSGTPDNVLRPIRNILRENSDKFPLDEIINHFKPTNKSLIFTDDEIEGLLSYKYGKKHTFAILSTIYPWIDYRNRFHQDHIFPRALFKTRSLKKKGWSDKQIKFFMDN